MIITESQYNMLLLINLNKIEYKIKIYIIFLYQGTQI
jgi:hypothetical protein